MERQRTESGEKPASHELLTLETLPNEIISSIAVMMTVDTNVPYVVSRPELSTSAKRKQEDANARQDLISLCMVSKRMASNLQKALYQNVLITHANTLILLYRTFLENPELGVYVKRMSLNIDHGSEHIDLFLGFPRHLFDSNPYFSNGSPIDLSPLLSQACAQRGLGEHFTEAVSRHAYSKIPVEMFFTLQFRVLSHTSNLESLDFNVHPLLPLIRT